MADQQNPTKNDIQIILKRLRSFGPNKVCFDCNSKNPTWATVTYGVFICIDCSAVHRSLGVHLTFVRSTQLDTNWTWLQLRQMQLGGNANAQMFFQQHNCTTTDAQQKYNSRAAQLYREKLHNAAIQAMKIHGTKLHLDSHHEAVHETEKPKKEVDFFEEHEKLQLADNNSEDQWQSANVPITPMSSSNDAMLSGAQPSVAGILSQGVSEAEPERKSIIGGRKPVAKKGGLGAKKGGLGAQRVKANFSEIEQKAAMADQLRENAVKEAKLKAERTAEEEEKQLASMQLAYKDLSIKQKKEEDKMRTVDPQKATQLERLGMGFGSRSGVSHSAMNDMQTITQEGPTKTFPTSLGKSLYDKDDFDDLASGALLNKFDNLDPVILEIFGMANKDPRDRFLDLMRDRKREKDTDKDNDHDFGREREKEKEKEPEIEKPAKSWGNTSNWDRSSSSTSSYRPTPRSQESTPSGTEAQKKFGGAKSISSDQFFSDSDNSSWERKANLSRFEGSTSISSADYFGNNTNVGSSGSGIGGQMVAPDLEDVKESVRQGVTKVAGKLSSLANGVMSSIQERYGG